MVPILGDWKMILYCREKCAICSLATSIITTDRGELHPDFEKVDEEARGIGISSGKLSTGESILRINFGVSYAGELRQITNDNFHHPSLAPGPLGRYEWTHLQQGRAANQL